MELVLTFSSTRGSIQAERLLLDGGVDARAMPLPSSIRAGCGIALRIAPEAFSAAERLLAPAVPVEGVYARAVVDGVAIYTPYERWTP